MNQDERVMTYNFLRGKLPLGRGDRIRCTIGESTERTKVTDRRGLTGNVTTVPKGRFYTRRKYNESMDFVKSGRGHRDRLKDFRILHPSPCPI